jgi:protein-tyrosine phosphatase
MRGETAMIDIHCHILPGVDDGAHNLEESVAMARLAHEDGIRHIIATPHFNCNYYNPIKAVRTKVKELQRVLDTRGIPVSIHPGNEVRLENTEDFYRDLEKGEFGTLDAAGKFLLLEQRFTEYQPDTLEVVTWLHEQGIRVILPHPERHYFFRDQPRMLEKLIAAGVWTQVSADSLIGRNNEEVRRFADWLVDRDFAHTLATDAHNVHRKPNLSEGFRIVRQRAGEGRVDEILARMDTILPDLNAADQRKAE